MASDRIGTTVEFIPQLFGADSRPTVQHGILMWFRTGNDGQRQRFQTPECGVIGRGSIS